MKTIDNIPVIGKFLIVLFCFAAVALLSVVYSTGQMQQIDTQYTDLIDHEGQASLFVTRANRVLTEAKGAAADLVITTTKEGHATAMSLYKIDRAKFLDYMNTARAADLSQASVVDALEKQGLNVLDTLCAKTIELGLSDATGSGLTEYAKSCLPGFEPAIKAMSAQTAAATTKQKTDSQRLTAVTNMTIATTYASIVIGLVAVVIGSYLALKAWVSRPIREIAETMAQLARGDLSVAVIGVERRDEIGPMARAVQVFKDNGLRLHETEVAAGRHRDQADRDRAAHETTRLAIQRDQQAVVACLAAGLDRLSHGDLTGRLSESFTADYEKLRMDFNATATSLQDALRTIVKATDGISSGSDEIATASDDLSRRTEQQAASLEETAAALNLITSTVQKMATGASQTAEVVATTRNDAEASGVIVDQAIGAMGKIKESSNKIAQIISVIDQIAFQTNLLALNAGVEAARAGDAGRGFAVVASEVRGLAQRSAESALEIKRLITVSTEQVDSGVDLVAATGKALTGIIEKVAVMDTLVREISAQSKEQAMSLAEVNIAINQMDQVVQQNAAMVEESTAAAHALKGDTQALTAIVSRFTIEAAMPSRGPAASGHPVHVAQARLAASVRR